MSDRLPAFVKVMERTSVRGPELNVLLAVASFAKPDGTGCFASHRQIARRAHMSERRAGEYLKRLCDRGELGKHFKAGPNGVNVYVVTCCADPEPRVPGDLEGEVPGHEKSTWTVSVTDPDSFGSSPGPPYSDKQEEQDLEQEPRSSSPTTNDGEDEYVSPEQWAELRGRLRGGLLKRVESDK